jgi:beta-lactamase superfamily II metal-dependent hydrolase
VLSRYEDAGIPVLRTDYDGGVRARVHNGLIQLDGARELRGYVHR